MHSLLSECHHYRNSCEQNGLDALRKGELERALSALVLINLRLRHKSTQNGGRRLFKNQVFPARTLLNIKKENKTFQF